LGGHLGSLPARTDALSAALATLRGLADSIGAVARLVDEKQKITGRLNAVIQERDKVAAELAEHRRRDDEILGRWLADGCEGPRPEPSAAALAAEKALARHARDAAAVETALPEENAAQQRLSQQLSEFARQRDEAVFRGAVEAVRSYAPDAIAALNLFLEWEAKFRSVAAALEGRRRGPDPDPLGGACAQQVREVIHQVKKEAGVMPDTVSGPRLLDRLTTHQDARL
jgi:hypothetical protein